MEKHYAHYLDDEHKLEPYEKVKYQRKGKINNWNLIEIRKLNKYIMEKNYSYKKCSTHCTKKFGFWKYPYI